MSQVITASLKSRFKCHSSCLKQLSHKIAYFVPTAIPYKYVSGDWPISTHADTTSRDILQRCAWLALADSPADIGLLWE